MGCGDQEMFRNCADVQIYSSVVGYPPNAIDIPSAIYLRDNTAPTGRRPLIIKYINKKELISSMVYITPPPIRTIHNIYIMF